VCWEPVTQWTRASTSDCSGADPGLARMPATLALQEQAKRMTNRIEHDPHVVLRLKVGKYRTDAFGPRHGCLHVVHCKVKMCLQLLSALDRRPHRPHMARFVLKVQCRSRLPFRRANLSPTVLGRCAGMRRLAACDGKTQ